MLCEFKRFTIRSSYYDYKKCTAYTLAALVLRLKLINFYSFDFTAAPGTIIIIIFYTEPKPLMRAVRRNLEATAIKYIFFVHSHAPTRIITVGTPIFRRRVSAEVTPKRYWNAAYDCNENEIYHITLVDVYNTQIRDISASQGENIRLKRKSMRYILLYFLNYFFSFH